MSNIDELVYAYREYVKHLKEEMLKMHAIVFPHGYRCSEEVYQKGCELREKIDRLEKAVSEDNRMVP